MPLTCQLVSLRMLLSLQVCLKRIMVHPPWGALAAVITAGYGEHRQPGCRAHTSTWQRDQHTALIAPSKSEATEQCFHRTGIFIRHCQRRYKGEPAIHRNKYIDHTGSCDLYHLHQSCTVAPHLSPGSLVGSVPGFQVSAARGLGADDPGYMELTSCQT